MGEGISQEYQFSRAVKKHGLKVYHSRSLPVEPLSSPLPNEDLKSSGAIEHVHFSESSPTKLGGTSQSREASHDDVFVVMPNPPREQIRSIPGE